MLSLAHKALPAPPPAPFILSLSTCTHTHLGLSTGSILLLQCLIATLSCQLYFTTPAQAPPSEHHIYWALSGTLRPDARSSSPWASSPMLWPLLAFWFLQCLEMSHPSTMLGQDMCLLDRDTERW